MKWTKKQFGTAVENRNAYKCGEYTVAKSRDGVWLIYKGVKNLGFEFTCKDAKQRVEELINAEV